MLLEEEVMSAADFTLLFRGPLEVDVALSEVVEMEGGATTHELLPLT